MYNPHAVRREECTVTITGTPLTTLADGVSVA
jgi:hypothetical protein